MTAIRATMIDADRCEAEGHSVKAAAPVLALCRKLIEAGYDPATPLHAYRGDVLALRVRSIGEGAKLTVTDSRCGTPVLRPWRDQQAGIVPSPPVRQTRLPTGSMPLLSERLDQTSYR